MEPDKGQERDHPPPHPPPTMSLSFPQELKTMSDAPCLLAEDKASALQERVRTPRLGCKPTVSTEIKIKQWPHGPR